MKIALNLGLKNNLTNKKYLVHAILNREKLNFLSGDSPYFVSIDFIDNAEIKKTYNKY